MQNFSTLHYQFTILDGKVTCTLINPFEDGKEELLPDMLVSGYLDSLLVNVPDSLVDKILQACKI